MEVVGQRHGVFYVKERHDEPIWQSIDEFKYRKRSSNTGKGV
jgi:hypothetical protein